jgi:hypothetical protein
MRNIKKTIAITAASALVIAGICVFTLAWTFSSNVMHPSYTCSEEHFIYCGDPSQLDLTFEISLFNPMMAMC